MNARGPADDRQFLGHPSGLAYLALTEAWERFSFFGMQTLLVLYMVGYLLLPAHSGDVIGFQAFQGALTSVFGPMSTLAMASLIFGFYSAFAYLLPVFGGIVGDRLIGQYRAVLAGAVLMSIGHFLMAFEAPFLLALTFLLVGTGLLKGNINTQVGQLYADHDRRRADAYQIFSVGINIGVVAAPFVCGTLGEVFGWHYGFGAAGVGMLIGLGIYIAGRGHLPQDRMVRQGTQKADPLTAHDWRVMAGLVFTLFVAACFLTATGQMASSYLIWIRQHVDRHVGGLVLPITWFLSVTGITSILLPPLLLAMWKRQAARGIEGNLVYRMGWGCVFGGSAFGFLALLSFVTPPGGLIHWPWLLVFHVLISLGYLFTWPVGLALFSRAAPLALRATFIGVYLLGNFFASAISGWLARFYERMPTPSFWLVQAAIGGAGALAVIVFGRGLSRLLAPRVVAAGAAGAASEADIPADRRATLATSESS